MNGIESRIQRVTEELTGNESLLEMLETDAAAEMLNWGSAVATSLVRNANEKDDIAEELAFVPRLKALRTSMRVIGNWAAGKYADPASRSKLRDNLLEQFKIIFGENAHLPSPEKLEALLNQVDDKTNAPRQLIVQLQKLLEESTQEKP